jgi:predicted AAA+ superfamily ATPase
MFRFFERDIYKDMLKWKRLRETGSTALALEISGPLGVGKTTIVNKFAKENYKNVINIDLGKQKDLDLVSVWKSTPMIRMYGEDSISNLIRLFSWVFMDSSDTAVIIDEVQESSYVYQLARQTNQGLKSHIIIINSFPGEVLQDKDFLLPDGDLYKLEMTPLTFEEFLNIHGKRRLWESLDLFGTSSKSDYDRIGKLFGSYLYSGGYPAPFNAHGQGKTDSVLYGLVQNFADESMVYLPDITDSSIFSAVLECVAYLIVNKKRGKSYFGYKLIKAMKWKYGIKYSERDIMKVVDWLIKSRILSPCNLAVNCDLRSVYPDVTLYFTDLGIARLFLQMVIYYHEDLSRLLFKNFVFLTLGKMIEKQRLLPDIPAFGMYSGEEIDFIVESRITGDTYAIKVKSGKDKFKTIDTLLDKKFVDKVLFVRKNTYGNRDGNEIVIPAYLFGRYDFNNGVSPFSKLEYLYHVDD